MHTGKENLNRITKAIIGAHLRWEINWVLVSLKSAMRTRWRWNYGSRASMGSNSTQFLCSTKMWQSASTLPIFWLMIRIVIELKASKGIDRAHIAQCINYLAATGKPICLLIHFGSRVEVKRIVRPGLQLDGET